MIRALLLVGALTAVGVAAPVPAERLPDPLAWGYMGVRVNQGTLRLTSVEPGTPAERAGLMADDDIIRIGDLKPRSFEDVVEHVSSFRPGTTLKVDVRRDGELKTFTLRLAVRPSEIGPPPIRTKLAPAIPEP